MSEGTETVLLGSRPMVPPSFPITKADSSLFCE